MLKRFSTVLLAAGMFLGVTPAAASAAFDVEHHRGGYRSCWYHDDWGWYRARCGGYHHHHHHGHDHYGHGDHARYYDRDRDSAHGSGDYDSHREHDR